jgi:nitrogen fixation/metabolism regulation signal transduction histidine kinase
MIVEPIDSKTNSGTGIDPKDRDNILEPFVTTKSNRMGMGLSICWSVIANHGGRLAVAPGQPQIDLPGISTALNGVESYSWT